MGANDHIEQVEENTPFSSIKQKNCFSVPQNYFDELPEKTMSRIHSSSKQKESFSLLKPAFSLASLAALTGIILLLVFSDKKTLEMDMVLSENELEHIIENPDLYNIHEDAITEEYLSLNIQDESGNEEFPASDEEIRTYLEENAEANNIINEY